MVSKIRRRSVLVVSAWLLLSESSAGAELQERTARAYDSYRDGAKTRFLARPLKPGDPLAGGIISGPAAEDGIIAIAGGLFHHWTDVVFIPGVTLQTALDVSRNFAAFPSIYKEIVASRVLERDGDKYRILLRLKDGDAGITGVLDVRSRVCMSFPTRRMPSQFPSPRRFAKCGEQAQPTKSSCLSDATAATCGRPTCSRRSCRRLKACTWKRKRLASAALFPQCSDGSSSRLRADSADGASSRSLEQFRAAALAAARAR